MGRPRPTGSPRLPHAALPRRTTTAHRLLLAEALAHRRQPNSDHPSPNQAHQQVSLDLLVLPPSPRR
jgi:hypothetical protein